jgi:hypothetical protein
LGLKQKLFKHLKYFSLNFFFKKPPQSDKENVNNMSSQHSSLLLPLRLLTYFRSVWLKFYFNVLEQMILNERKRIVSLEAFKQFVHVNNLKILK